LSVRLTTAYCILLSQLINASAPGNQPTEGLIRYFNSLSIETGIDVERGLLLAKTVRRELYSKISLNKD
jgi:hypothetical protein